MKVSLGINKKVGLPNYGSAGSLCTIDLDMDDTLLNSPDEFRRRVQNAYAIARESVEAELAHHRSTQSNGQSQQSYQEAPQQRQEYHRSNENSGNSYNGNNSYGNQSTGQKNYIASPKQISFIFNLTKKIQGMDARKLERYADKKFGKAVNQLSPKEAHQLIEELLLARDNGGMPA